MLILLRSLLKNKTRSKIFNLSYFISLSCISAVTCVVLGDNKIFVVASNYLLAFPFYVSHMVRKAAQRFSRISSIQSQSLFTFFIHFLFILFFFMQILSSIVKSGREVFCTFLLTIVLKKLLSLVYSLFSFDFPTQCMKILTAFKYSDDF